MKKPASPLTVGRFQAERVRSGLIKGVYCATLTLLTIACSEDSEPVTGITIAPAEVTLAVDESYSLKILVSPHSASQPALIWKSSNSSVATVSAEGLVTGVSHGTATVTATTTDGKLTSSCPVTIVQWTSYTTADGLVDNETYSIGIDANHNKWVGTYFGVSKFDGTNWTTYNQTNSGLANNWVFSISEDDQGTLWFGTATAVSSLSGNTWTTFDKYNSNLVGNPVSSIRFDQVGTMWVATTEGASKVEGTTWTNYTMENSGLPNDLVGDIAVADNGDVWFATGNGVARLRGTTWQVFKPANGLAGFGVTAVTADGDVVWFGTFDGLSRYDGTKWTTYFAGNDVYCVAVDKRGNLWAGSSIGLHRFDGTTWTSFNTSNSGLPTNAVVDIAIDADNTKWLATFNGISRLQD